MPIDWQGSGWLRQKAAEKAAMEQQRQAQEYAKSQKWGDFGRGLLGAAAETALNVGGNALGEYAKQNMPDAQLDRRYKQQLIEQGERQGQRADVRMAGEQEQLSAARAAQQQKELEDRQRWGMDKPGTPAIPAVAGPSAQGPRPSPGASELGPDWTSFSGRRGKEGATGMGRMGGEGVQGTPAIPPSPFPTVGGSQVSSGQMERAAAKVKNEQEQARAAAISKAQFAALKHNLGKETVKRGRSTNTLRTEEYVDAGTANPIDYIKNKPMQAPAMGGGGGGAGAGKVKSRFFDENLKPINPDVVYGAATPAQLPALQAFNEGKGDPAAIETGRRIYQGMIADGTIRGAKLKAETAGGHDDLEREKLKARVEMNAQKLQQLAEASQTRALTEYEKNEARQLELQFRADMDLAKTKYSGEVQNWLAINKPGRDWKGNPAKAQPGSGGPAPTPPKAPSIGGGQDGPVSAGAFAAAQAAGYTGPNLKSKINAWRDTAE